MTKKNSFSRLSLTLLNLAHWDVDR